MTIVGVGLCRGWARWARTRRHLAGHLHSVNCVAEHGILATASACDLGPAYALRPPLASGVSPPSCPSARAAVPRESGARLQSDLGRSTCRPAAASDCSVAGLLQARLCRGLVAPHREWGGPCADLKPPYGASGSTCGRCVAPPRVCLGGTARSTEWRIISVAARDGQTRRSHVDRPQCSQSSKCGWSRSSVSHGSVASMR